MLSWLVSGVIPGIGAWYPLCVYCITHLFTSMINTRSHIYLEEKQKETR